MTADPTLSLREWPASLRRFGLNPFNEPIWRIVFAPSRRTLICDSSGGTTVAKYLVRYPWLGNQWIMERWLPVEEYAKCTREQWNADPNSLILGPYPERGEYELCHVFETSGPDDANLEKLITWIEMGRRTPFYDTHVFQRNDAEREQKAISDTQEAMIRNWLPAFGSAPMSGPGGGRSAKSAPIPKMAEELGLPTQGGQMQARKPRNAEKFSIDLSQAVR